MTKHFAKAGMLALLMLCMAPLGQAQTDQQDPDQLIKQQDDAKKDATPIPVSKTSKAEDTAYKALFDARTGDPAHIAALGEGFLNKFPKSIYLGSVYDLLTGAYLQTNQTDKMMDTGTKALALNPNDVDVLPVMAWAMARQGSTKTPEGQQQLQKAASYAHQGMDLINSLAKPALLDEASFAKAKNDKLSMCHSSLGAIAVKTGKYPDAIPELTAALQLAIVPDHVDYYLLGFAEEQTNHFTGAQEAYGKCSVSGSPVQSQCKAGIEDVKVKARTELEAPN